MDMITSVDSRQSYEAFREEIWNELDSLPWNNSVNISVQITNKALHRMMTDDNFRNQMMQIMHEEASGCRPPFICTCLTVIDETGHSGFSYNDHIMGNNAFAAHSLHEDSFYVRKSRAQEIDAAWQKLLQIREKDREIFEEQFWDKTYYSYTNETS